MTDHDLKTWPPFFDRLLTGEKTFELRRNDRGFLVGDLLTLREWDPSLVAYTGRRLQAEVLEVFRAEDIPEGLAPGFVVLQIRVQQFEGRDLIVTVQALQNWLCHNDDCAAVHRAACEEACVDPDEPDCDCGLALEWSRRFFPLGALGTVCQALVDGGTLHRHQAEALPSYWRDAVLLLAKRLDVKVLDVPGAKGTP